MATRPYRRHVLDDLLRVAFNELVLRVRVDVVAEVLEPEGVGGGGIDGHVEGRGPVGVGGVVVWVGDYYGVEGAEGVDLAGPVGSVKSSGPRRADVERGEAGGLG